MDTWLLILVMGGGCVVMLFLTGLALWITDDGYHGTRVAGRPPLELRAKRRARHRAEDLDSPTRVVRGGHFPSW